MKRSASPGLSAAMIGTLSMLSAMGPFASDITLPALPDITDAMHSSQSSGQLAVSATFFGMSLGQALAGPFTDRFGRRRPSIVGSLAFAVIALLCSRAPSMAVLIGLCLLLGGAGAIAVVATRAAVSDVAIGDEASRLYSLLGVINGIAPVASPVLGAQLLRVTDWRGVYLAVACVGLALSLASVLWFTETLQHHERDSRSFAETMHIWRGLLSDCTFMSYAMALVGCIAALFTYISSSPFVLQGIFGLSQQMFSVVFAVNALGMLGFTQLNMVLVRRFGALRMLQTGVAICLAGSIVLVAGAALASFPLVWLGYFCIPGSIGFTFSNAMALVLDSQVRDRGSAAGLLGLLPFSFAVVVAPLAGLGGRASALPFGLVCLAVTGVAAVAAVSAGRVHPSSTTAVAA